MDQSTPDFLIGYEGKTVNNAQITPHAQTHIAALHTTTSKATPVFTENTMVPRKVTSWARPERAILMI